MQQKETGENAVREVTLKELREIVEHMPETTILSVEYPEEAGDEDGE